MNKLLIAISAVSALTMVTFDAAEAQQRGYGNRGGYNNVYRNNGNRYVQNNFYGNRGGYYGGRGWNNGAAWAAGLGGLAVGAIIGGAIASQPAYAAPIGVPVSGPVCQQVQISQRLVPNGAGGYYYAPIYAQQCY